MSMTHLPNFFVMRVVHEIGIIPSYSSYLYPPENPPSNMPSGFLEFDERQVLSPRVKFAAEQSKTTGDLVHIRSCFNNKYWVAHEAEGRIWVVASADKPEEDQSNPACTLFRVTGLSSSWVSLFSIGKSMNVSSVQVLGGGLVLVTNDGPAFTIIDWETLVILPSQVSFRSEDLNDNYLCSRVLDRYYNYHRFEPNLDIGDPQVAYELFPNYNGTYRIKSLYYGMFWKRSSTDWIWADAEKDDGSNDPDFKFVKISNELFAVRNVGNDKFCGAISKDYKEDALIADYPTLSKQTRLKIEERVLQREISGVKYRLSDSRIYEEEIQEVANAFGTNDSPNKDDTITLTYSITDSRTSTWSNSVSANFGVTTKFEVSVIPLIATAGIELTTELGYTHEWGTTTTQEQKRESSYVVVVPPLTTVKVTLLCTKAACDVPFSYTQRDLLTTGEWVSTTKDDGIYTGINSYNFYFQSSTVTKDAEGRLFV